MKHEITSSKYETNSKVEIISISKLAFPDLGFQVYNFKRLKGVL